MSVRGVCGGASSLPDARCGYALPMGSDQGGLVGAVHCHNLEHEDMMMMANFEVV